MVSHVLRLRTSPALPPLDCGPCRTVAREVSLRGRRAQAEPALTQLRLRLLAIRSP